MNKRLATGVQVALGFLLGIALTGVLCWAGLLVLSLLDSWGFGHGRFLAAVQFLILFFFGVVQLLWQVPLILLLRRKADKGLALGVILAASVIFLLNATCWVYLKTAHLGPNSA